ncbi:MULTISPECIES: MbtH family protein [unclassified Bradyrhizobium]|uniref:MbtH family protein n=1 Tax=unclassified Bradyrhizobium TaxID=2631580 RepID=UPI0028EF268A|nr:MULTISPECIES: MbtH family protein [unclassified Bradyrhizobium]
MQNILDDENQIYSAVINFEEQYSLWPMDRDPPKGWTRVGPQCNRQEVLEYIKSTWRDMRPLSLRKAMDGTGLQTN